tara:strand:+ start:696 stop:905 length:210 start_codon:yes stop_codon:yes gene_type:complete
MKKVLLIAAVAVLALASCKKDRTCTCTIDLGIEGVPAQTVSETAKLSKKDAKTWCEDAAVTEGVTCELD